MDLLAWLCGCLLAALLPAAASTEEGGEFGAAPPAPHHTATGRCEMEIKPHSLTHSLCPSGSRTTQHDTQPAADPLQIQENFLSIF